LTEVGDWQVLLIEAGEDESIYGQVPLLAPYLQKTSADWQYTTTPQGSFACTAIKDNKYEYIMKGKLIDMLTAKAIQFRKNI